MPPEPDYFPDPVAAYDRLALHFDHLARGRRQYLEGVEKLIISGVQPNSRSLLDVGAGDGRRALRIAARAGLQRVVLLEPSRQMARQTGEAEVWALRLEGLDSQKAPASGNSFDVITCLWNVLGHIQPERTRGQVLSSLRAMLSPDGVLYVDVNHRYNVSSYGAVRTAFRFLQDRLWPSEFNGDVTAKWDLQGSSCSTYGHVFTDREMRLLAAAAGLEVHERIVVDYDTGEVRRFGFQGNLLYILRPRRSESALARAVQTSSTSASAI